MRKWHRKLIKGTNWALAGMLSLFGFTNCADQGGGELMYGVPWKNYAIKGKVTNKETKEAIPGLEVKIAIPDSIKNKYFPQGEWTVKTGTDGTFKLTDALEGDSIPIAIRDIDGQANGSFDPDTIYTSSKDSTTLEGNHGGWFEGELTRHLKIELEEKKKDE